MQYHRKLSRKCNFGLLHASTSSKLHCPALKSRPFNWACQYDVRCFLKRSPHTRVADFGDTPTDVCLTGLVFSWSQSEMGADSLGWGKSRRIINCGNISQGHDGADTRRRHGSLALASSRAWILTCFSNSRNWPKSTSCAASNDFAIN